MTQYADPLYLEAVYAALFLRLQSAVFPIPLAFASSTRAVVEPDSIPAADQPALLLFPGPIEAQQNQVKGLTKFVFSAVAAVYLRADGTAAPGTDQSPLPATVANYITWGIVNALAPSVGGVNNVGPYQRQTLGGLVYHCWLEGNIIPQVINGQMVIWLPIMILPE